MDKAQTDLIHRGVELFDAGRYDEAELVFTEVLDIDPAHPNVHNCLGMIQHHRGRLDEASEHFREAVRLNPGYAEASLNLAVTLSELGRYEEAEAAMVSAAPAAARPERRSDPYVLKKLANEHYRIGKVYLELDRYEDAAHEFEKAASLHPEMPDVLVRHGMALRALGRVEEALEKYRGAVRLNPGLTIALLQMASTLYEAGRLEEARAELQRALAERPDLEQARIFLDFLREKD